MDQITTRLSQCDLKFAQKEGAFSGYGSVFGNVDSHNDVVMPGAYDDVLKSGEPVQVYVNHGWLSGELPVGQWSALSADEVGLKGTADLVMQMPSAVNAYWAMKSGLVTGLSVAIQPHIDGVVYNKDGIREIHRIKRLKEISIVNDPSNDRALVTSVKTAEFMARIDAIDSVREIESFLRDAGGLTKGAALAFVARAKTVFGVTGEPLPAAIEAKSEALILERLQKLAK
jgi:HK97 family phage prohead protease